jgi:predicted kinase
VSLNDNVYCTVGVQGSGKSFFAKKMKLEHKAVIINLDKHFYKDGVYCWNPQIDNEAWDKLIEELKNELRWPHTTIVVDDIFFFLDRRKQIINLCMEYGRPSVAVYFDTPVEECLNRNSNRSNDRKIPEDVIRIYHSKIAKPSPLEGWRSIKRFTPDGKLQDMWDKVKNKKSDKLQW